MLRSVEELKRGTKPRDAWAFREKRCEAGIAAPAMLRDSLARDLNLAERDLFEFGGPHCDQVVANVLSRLEPELSASSP